MTEATIQTQRADYQKQMQERQGELQKAQQQVSQLTTQLHTLNGALLALEALEKAAPLATPVVEASKK